MVVVHECGGGDFWLRKRKMLRSVQLCYLTLFCRKMLSTGGVGFPISSMVTLFEEPISISHHLIYMWSGVLFIWFGWSKSRWRSRFLCGDFFATYCHQKTIWFEEAFFIQMTTLVLVGAAVRSQHITFFFRCNIFGSLWYLIYQWVGIFFISPVLVADRFHHFGHYVDLPRFTHAVMPTLSWFGMLLFGFFGRREITGFLRTLLKIWFSY